MPIANFQLPIGVGVFYCGAFCVFDWFSIFGVGPSTALRVGIDVLDERFECVLEAVEVAAVGHDVVLGERGVHLGIGGLVAEAAPDLFDVGEEGGGGDVLEFGGCEAGGAGGELPGFEVALDDHGGVSAMFCVLAEEEFFGVKFFGDAADVVEELIGGGVGDYGGTEAGGGDGGVPCAEATDDCGAGEDAEAIVVLLGEDLRAEGGGGAAEVGEHLGVGGVAVVGAELEEDWSLRVGGRAVAAPMGNG